MFNKALSVEELNKYIHQIFLAEEMLIGVSVFGEVSGVRVSGPHAYFTVKGESAAISCTLFSYARTYLPKDGESVLLKGSPDYYVKTGKLSFNVTQIQPIGVGKLHVELEKLKAALAKEGVFDESHKKPIPRFSKDVCVITSKTGAVIRDIYRTIRNVNRSINIHVYNVRVQGEGAENEIARAIERTDKKFDVIIVARGGGSFEDLAPFNTEIVARAIYRAETPIVSAVGHETDFSLSDFAADARAATPTAAAHLVAYDESEILSSIFNSLSEMGLSLQQKEALCEKDLTRVVRAIERNASLLSERGSAKLRSLLSALSGSHKLFVRKKESDLEKILVRLSGLNPLAELAKGYAAASVNGRRVSSARDVQVGDEMELVLKDGALKAQIKEIRYDV